MTATDTLIAKLTAEALRLAVVDPEIVERDGVLSLRAGRIGLGGRHHVAYLGLRKEGVRRLTAELRRVVDAMEG